MVKVDGLNVPRAYFDMLGVLEELSVLTDGQHIVVFAAVAVRLEDQVLQDELFVVDICDILQPLRARVRFFLVENVVANFEFSLRLSGLDVEVNHVGIRSTGLHQRVSSLEFDIKNIGIV